MFSRILFPFLMTVIIVISSMSLSAQDDRLQLVASHSILADVVRNVAGDQADLTPLMPVGADPHSFQPSPRDLTAVAEADLVFVNGARFEESLLADVENAAGDGRVIEASACVEIIASGSSAHDDHDEHDEDGEHDEADDHDEEGEHDDHDDEHDDEHDEDDDHDDEHDEADEDDEHDDEHDEHDEMEASGHCDDHDGELAAFSDDEHSHDDIDTLGRLEQIDCGGGHSEEDEDEEDEHAHSHGVCDPHVWMNPHNVMYWTLMIRDSLAEADPANAEAYRANAAAYLNQLHDLSHDFIEPALEALPQQKRVLITSHDSLGYLAARYDFDIIGTVGGSVSTLSEPSARRVADLIDLIQTDGISAIFGETTANEDVMEMMAGETGAELVTLYSGTLSGDDGPAATYLDYMRYNLGSIIGALQGAD